MPLSICHMLNFCSDAITKLQKSVKVTSTFNHHYYILLSSIDCSTWYKLHSWNKRKLRVITQQNIYFRIYRWLKPQLVADGQKSKSQYVTLWMGDVERTDTLDILHCTNASCSFVNHKKSFKCPSCLSLTHKQ